MSMIHREEGEQQQQQAEQYDMVRLWEARERDRDVYPRPITTSTQGLLRQVGLLKFYEEATSLKGHGVCFETSYPQVECPPVEQWKRYEFTMCFLILLL